MLVLLNNTTCSEPNSQTRTLLSFWATLGVATAATIGFASTALGDTRPNRVKIAQAPGVQPPATPSPPPGQGETKPVTVQLKSNSALADWTKVCGNDPASNAEVCYTTRDFVSEQGQPALAVAVYDAKSGPQAGAKIIRFMTPVSLLLPQGLRFAVDQTHATAGRYQICYPNGCVAEAMVRDEVVSALKKGSTLSVSVLNQAGREVTFTVPLAGFGKAFDGPPIAPEALRKQQESFQKEAERRAQELRGQVQQGSGAPASAPPGRQ